MTEDVLEIHPADAAARGISDGHRVRIASAHGEAHVHARVTDRVREGTVFLSFHFPETGANALTGAVNEDNGGSGDNYRGTVFDMGCATAVTGAMAPFRGCFRPESSFAAFLSGPANGTWTLRVGDDAGSDSGTLTAWSLALCIDP